MLLLSDSPLDVIASLNQLHCFSTLYSLIIVVSYRYAGTTKIRVTPLTWATRVKLTILSFENVMVHDTSIIYSIVLGTPFLHGTSFFLSMNTQASIDQRG